MKDTSSIAVPFVLGNLIYDEIKPNKTSPLISTPSGNENFMYYSPKFQSSATDVVLESVIKEDVNNFAGKKGDFDEVTGENFMVSSKTVEQKNEIGNVVYVPKVVEFSCIPLWGITSICGRRAEMEDTAIALPNFLRIPKHMLIDDHVDQDLNGASCNLPDTSGNFYGIYDGHGGSQVANYCHDRLHLALVEEIDVAKKNWDKGYVEDSWQKQWEKTLLSCFTKVDAEVARKPVAADAVGSTAVVVVVCPKHIVVANCGDSRAVLCRGKLAIPLSEDHKPNRKDEQERIETAGGKVIDWDGYRVSGVLAMSRSIGDRYLDPYVISDPEITFVSRSKEDECLILASDGLWDVVKDQEACEIARKRILLWHKKNGNTIFERGEGVDHAAQDAADYLSKLALHKGSSDNISVIVIDLKAQRRSKKRLLT